MNPYRQLDWVVDCGSVCHGFAGYFSAILYGDKKLSILPEAHSVNLISWFPVFFPLRSPIVMKKGIYFQSVK